MVAEQLAEAAGVLFPYVILLEDDPAHALIIKRALRPFCGEIKTFDSLNPGVQACRERVPDLIVTDLHLKDTHEVTNVAILKEAISGGPVLVLTSSTSLHDAVGAMRLGADDFLVKEFGPDFHEILGFSLRRIKSGYDLLAVKRKIERQMAALRQAIENSTDALAVARADGSIEYSNSSFVAFAQRAGGQSISLRTMLGEAVSDSAQTQRSILDKLTSLPLGAVWHTEIRLAKETGEATGVAFDLSLSAIARGAEEDPGSNSSFVVWVRDISEQRRREKFQREILSTTTHDLKGPLGAIIISAELMSDAAQGNRKVTDLALRVGSSAHTAVNLIDEFLSARRIQEGNFLLKPHAQQVNTLVGEVVDGFQAVAASKSITVTTEGLDTSLTWNLDKLGVTRALGNLLSNAFKFTPRGGQVLIAVGSRGNKLSIAVKDSGAGMEPGEVQRIFQRFSRLEKHRDIPGSGLGLFVVKSVVAAHGGTVEVTSAVGQGTTFDMLFPADPPVNERGELICLDFA